MKSQDMNEFPMHKRDKIDKGKIYSTVSIQVEDDPRRMETEGSALSPAETTWKTNQELRVYHRALERQNEELKITLVALNALRKRYANFYELAPVGYVVLSEEGMIMEANLRASIMLGVPKATLVNQSLIDFFVDEDRKIYHLFCKALVDTFEPQVFDLRMKQQEGAPLWVRLTTTVVENQRKGARICLATISYIAEVRAPRSLLTRMEAPAPDLAHEISNPLTAVVHDLECLLEDLPNLTSVVTKLRHALRELVGSEMLAELAGESASMINPRALEGLIKRAKRASKGTVRIKEIVKEFTASSHVEQDSLSMVDLNHATKRLRRVDRK